jgi:hypothetical protein
MYVCIDGFGVRIDLSSMFFCVDLADEAEKADEADEVGNEGLPF